MLKPGALLIYKTPKVGQWVGTVLLHCCELIERPSKKDGFCFKLFHPLDQSVWAVKVPLGRGGSGGPGPAPGRGPTRSRVRDGHRWAGRRPVLAPPPQGVWKGPVGSHGPIATHRGAWVKAQWLMAGKSTVVGGLPGRAHGRAQGQGTR